MRYGSMLIALFAVATPASAQNPDRLAHRQACREEARVLHPKRKVAQLQAEEMRRAFMAECMARKGYKLKR